jgi:EpsI family protein
MSRRSGLFLAAVAILSVQGIWSRVVSREPFLPSPPPLSGFPSRLGNWSEVMEERIPDESLAALGPDDFVARIYQSPGASAQAELFVAYYKTQLRAKNAHDPKVCLPGAGWNTIASRSELVSLKAGPSMPVNYYRIKKDREERVVLYWFQTLNGVYTLEQQLKAHRLWDAVFENRTDMALVRLIVPVTSSGTAEADKSASELAPIVYTQMLPYFPPTRTAKL